MGGPGSGRKTTLVPGTRGAERVLDHVAHRGITLAAFAGEVGIDPSYLHRLLKSTDPNVMLDILKRLKQRVGGPVDDWLKPPQHSPGSV